MMNWREHFGNGIRGSAAKPPAPQLFGALPTLSTTSILLHISRNE
jgi:hypothetical protein